jgi:hypothetical protein
MMDGEIALEELIDSLIEAWRSTPLPILPRCLSLGVCDALFPHVSEKEYAVLYEFVLAVVRERIGLTEAQSELVS